MQEDAAGSERRADRRPTPTRATVVVEGASVTILPRRAPVGSSGPIRGHSLAVFPGPPASEAALRSALPPRHHDLYSATLEPGGRPGLAVLDLTQADAKAAGQALGLSELLFWDGRRASILVL